MDIQLNKDLQQMQDNFVFGLNARQTVCSLAGLLLGGAVYFFVSRRFGTDAASWCAILLVAPCAALGFVKYHGMPFERLVLAWYRQYVLCKGVIGATNPPEKKPKKQKTKKGVKDRVQDP